MGRNTNSSRTKSSAKNGRAKKWDGDPDYLVAFQRPENEDPQPKYTGQGLISRATLKAIAEAGGDCQVACWVRRSRSGVRYISIHVEPPWEEDNDGDQDDLDDDDDESADETPF